MMYILLVLLLQANEEAIDIFNTLSNEKKLLILKLLKKIFEDEFNKEIALYKRIYRAYEAKRVELTILYEFGVEQGYINEATAFTDDIDYQLFYNFDNVDSLRDM